MSGKRCTLHKTKLEAFKDWLDVHEIPHRPGKGDWQVLQVFTGEKNGWQCVFEKATMPEHYSVNEKLLPIVIQFVKAFHKEGGDELLEKSRAVAKFAWDYHLSVVSWAKAIKCKDHPDTIARLEAAVDEAFHKMDVAIYEFNSHSRII